MKKLFENWRKHITEAEYEPGRAVTDINTGEERMSPEEINDEEVQDLADKFNVEAFVEIASDGRASIIVKHQDGKVAMYNDIEKMYQDLAKRQEMNEGLDQINPENMGILMNALKHFASQPAVLSAMAMGGVAAAVSKIKDMMDQEDAMDQDD